MRGKPFLPIVLFGKSILLREGLARILRAGNFRIIASVSSADDLPPCKSTPHPLLLIVHTGEDFDTAVEQIELLRSRHPDGRIAIVADHYQPKDLTSAFRAGANGYFINAITCDRFVKSVELVMLGETIFPPAFLSFILDPGTSLIDGSTNAPDSIESGEPILLAAADPAAPLLSPREKLILHCLIEGDSNKCIARKMDIAEATVKVHVKAILRKIRVQNRTQAAIWGMNNGSQVQLESGDHPLSISSISKSLVDHANTVSVAKGAEPLAPPHIEAARIQRLGRKATRTSVAVRLLKQS
jgi:DNA-binding NarL/FixJ family response regulator